MTGSRTLCVVHNNIDDSSSIGKLASWAVRVGLSHGYRVSVVARDLSSDLQSDVEHLPLYVPPRVHAVQWAVARATVRRAIGHRRFDVVHTFQPQIATIADTWHVQFLSRAARRLSMPATTARQRLSAAQCEIVARMEDRYLRGLPLPCKPLFCSAGMRETFTRLYGSHPNAAVLHNPALDMGASGHASPDARARLTGGHAGPVIGFLGGSDPRKGGDDLVRCVALEPDVFLLAAGPHVERLDATILDGRYHSLGMLTALDDFFASIDVLLVPSRFEPFGLVVAEAAARGVPTLATAEVGSLPLLEACGAGRAWSPGQSMSAEVRAFRSNPAHVRQGCAQLMRALDPDVLGSQLARTWEVA